MKGKIFKGATVVMMTVVITTFGQGIKKTVQEPENRKLANPEQNLRITKVDSVTDFQWFRREAEMRLKDYHEKMAFLKEKKSGKKEETEGSFGKKMVALEERNDDLKVRLKASKSLKSSKFTAFKNEFTLDMNALGIAIRDVDRRTTK